MGVLALWFLMCNLRLSRRLLRSRRELEAGSHRLKVYMTDAVESPCLYGLFRPAVYLSERAAADPAEAELVIAHELTHRRHGDHIWAAVRLLCLTAYWFDPFVWLAASLSKRDGDLDFSALRKKYSPEEIIGLLAFLCGLIPSWEKVTAKELVREFSWDKLRGDSIYLDAASL